jgi:hypothetical protein
VKKETEKLILLKKITDNERRSEKVEEKAKSEADIDFEETRRCLLNIAHSKNQTHAGYLIAIIIGALTIISRWDAFFSPPEQSVTPVTIAFFFIIGSIAFVTVYMIKRTLYWNAYTSSVLNLGINEARELYIKYIKAPPEYEPKKDVPDSCILNAAAVQHMVDLREKENAKWYLKIGVMEEKESVSIAFILGFATGFGLLLLYLAVEFFFIILVLGIIVVFLYSYPTLRRHLWKFVLKYCRKTTGQEK